MIDSWYSVPILNRSVIIDADAYKLPNMKWQTTVYIYFAGLANVLEISSHVSTKDQFLETES